MVSLVCTRCKEDKEETLFAVSNITKTGRKTRCKSCESELERDRRERKHEEILLKDRERRATPERKEFMLKVKKEWRAKNPEKVSAHRKVQRAVAKGSIVKTPCEVCGSPEVEGHHPDYSLPLNVMWLCMTHHKQLHKESRGW